jgi:hypothetical protein
MFFAWQMSQDIAILQHDLMIRYCSYPGNMYTRRFLLLPLVLLFVAAAACDDGESVPDFSGLWKYDQATPAENIDSCYQGSWMWLYENKDFDVYDACEDSCVSGWWESKGLLFQVWFEEEGFDDFEGRILILEEKVMVVETSMFGTLTRLRFVRMDEPGTPCP